MILVTDGRTKDDIVQISREMREQNDTTVVAVGLYRAPLEELLTIASSQDHGSSSKAYRLRLKCIFHSYLAVNLRPPVHLKIPPIFAQADFIKITSMPLILIKH